MLEETKVKAASALRLPKDVVLGEVLVSFLGRQSVVIENYRSIILYTDCLIKIQAKNCRVIIGGSRLMIEYYTNEEMKINGYIKSLEFD